MKGKSQPAAGLTQCPAMGCEQAPAPWFCPTHWDKVPGAIRRRIISTTKDMTGRGIGPLPTPLAELLIEAIRSLK